VRDRWLPECPVARARSTANHNYITTGATALGLRNSCRGRGSGSDEQERTLRRPLIQGSRTSQVSPADQRGQQLHRRVPLVGSELGER
jgi:hypothetical protein